MIGISLFAYLVAGIFFIMALRGLSSPETARKGNFLGVLGMLIAGVTTLTEPVIKDYSWIIYGIAIGGIIGTVIAKKVKMTSLPQLVAIFNSLVGLAAVFIAFSAFLLPEAYGIGESGNISVGSLVEMSLGMVIGAVTFTGSVVAFAKLQGLLTGNPIIFPLQQLLNLIFAITIILLLVLFAGNQSGLVFAILALVTLIFGILIIIPIGGADMPVVISMLNSYSGFAAVGVGFTLHNSLLIITGALVGASGAILSYIMCKAMNRSFTSVILGGFGAEAKSANDDDGDEKIAKAGSAEDVAFIMKNSSKVIIVPGYGMAVAQAQHAVREMADLLKKEGVEVKYAIHPVAGRMPGHMNVLLAEANVPYDEVFELEDINSEFSSTDVVCVIGANDVVNPKAKTDEGCAIYGMPVLDVDKAKTVVFIKRSLASGYAGIDNPLFYADKTLMLFGGAKKMTEEINRSMEG
ncbi:MAG: NAD(P)(+) transhydrogenase (Re/Si-specific) subunit beta [Alphaproteobacteria bacterium]|nr:NAD(P)(+) transhydrogenase (Re/Si-specific) subunit beta [Alphaproteobacteria bacterium]